MSGRVFTAQDVFLAAMRQHTPVREEPLNSNRGQMVEAYQRANGGKPGDSWCMQLQNYVGRMAFGATWPLHMTGSTNEAAADAKAKGILFESSEAEPGDIFLLFSRKSGLFHHAGAVANVITGATFPTYEGNTNKDGSSNGFGFFAKSRDVKPGDKVIKWWRVMS